MARLYPDTWPLRWRIAVLNMSIVAVTLLFLGVLFLALLDHALINISAEYLHDQSRTALSFVQDGERGRPRGGGPGGPGGPPGPLSPVRGAEFVVRRLSGPDTGVFVFDAAGSVIARSDSLEDIEAWPQPPRDLISTALSGTENRTVVSQQSRRTLLLVLPLRGPERDVIGVLTVASSLELVEQLQSSLRTALGAGTLLAALLAGILGLRGTRAALKPLDRVIETARNIAAGHLDVRLRLHRRDEIGELAEAFDSMLDRLAAALKAQRRFVADAAHELRTPLTALGGMVEMLEMGADRGDKATVSRMLQTMNKEIDRLTRLVSDLLTLSRLDAELPLTTGTVDLRALVHDVAGQTRLLARGQQVDVKISDTPQVNGNQDQLKQVLLNLADNALKFTPTGGRIEFQLGGADGTVTLSVADTGAGIPADTLPRVTERFERGDPSRSRATGGFGLGLAIARDIVEAHGGRLSIESQVSQGTTVHIVLPRLSSANTQIVTSAA
ncbi:MAG: sensor histidine kinase [Chloroflexota bacterium]